MTLPKREEKGDLPRSSVGVAMEVGSNDEVANRRDGELGECWNYFILGDSKKRNRWRC